MWKAADGSGLSRCFGMFDHQCIEDRYKSNSNQCFHDATGQVTDRAQGPRVFLAAVKEAGDDTVNYPSLILICWGQPESSWTPQVIQALNQEPSSVAIESNRRVSRTCPELRWAVLPGILRASPSAISDKVARRPGLLSGMTKPSARCPGKGPPIDYAFRFQEAIQSWPCLAVSLTAFSWLAIAGDRSAWIYALLAGGVLPFVLKRFLAAF